jgi:hypothetical protein
MTIGGAFKAALPIVADSFAKLRGCDVYRLIDRIGYLYGISVREAAEYIIDQRPGLKRHVEQAVAEIAEQQEEDEDEQD